MSAISRLIEGLLISRQETFAVKTNKLGSAILVLKLSAENNIESSGSFTKILSALIPAPKRGVVIIFAFSKSIDKLACSLAIFWISGLN